MESTAFNLMHRQFHQDLESLRKEAWEVFQKLDKEGKGEIRIKDVQQHLDSMKKAFQEIGVNLEDEYFDNLVKEMLLYSNSGQKSDSKQISPNNSSSKVKLSPSQEAEQCDYRVTFDDFEMGVRKGLELMRRARNGKLIIPDFKRFCDKLLPIYDEVSQIKAGKNASYIPILEHMDPEYWAFAVQTVDGQTFSHGYGHDVDFSMQSCSKPLMYCLASEELGVEEVHQYVGCEPSGSQFNAFTLTDSNKPFNPFLNTGAISICSLLFRDKDPSERFSIVQSFFREVSSGAKIGFNNAIFLSERNSADRNKALAYFMNEHDCFPKGTRIEDVLDFYFQTCSLEANVQTMACIAATLANGGICPGTGKRLLSSETVKNCLIMLFSCGMYNYSGEWAFHVGLPAKSGVSGCIMVVIPNVMGLCTFSPRLDFRGNSVRGIEFCKRLAKEFNFHIFTQLVGVEVVKVPPGQAKPWLDHKSTSTSDKMREIGIKLCAIASQGDLVELQALVTSHRAAINAGDYDRRTPLHLAACEGHFDIVKFLIAYGADVNVADRWGGTPLDDAKRHGHDDVINFLLENGATSGMAAKQKEKENSKKAREDHPKAEETQTQQKLRAKKQKTEK